MNREQLTRMAREAGFVGFDGSNKMLRKFAALVAAAARKEENEACAKVCEAADKSTHPADLADAIRARGNT